MRRQRPSAAAGGRGECCRDRQQRGHRAHRLLRVGRGHGGCRLWALLLNGSADAFVAKVSGANGACIWSRSIGGGDNDFGFVVAIDPHTNCDGVGGHNWVVASGDFRFSANFGAGAVTELWIKHFSNLATSVANNASVDPSTGNAAMTGPFQGIVDFGVGTLTSAGSNDIFLLTSRRSAIGECAALSRPVECDVPTAASGSGPAARLRLLIGRPSPRTRPPIYTAPTPA